MAPRGQAAVAATAALATLLQLLLLSTPTRAQEPLEDGQLGARCLRSGRCLVVHSRCEDGVCNCVQRMVPSARGRRCLPVTEQLGGGCEEDAQCLVEHSACKRRLRVCACRRGQVEAAGRCMPELALGDACDHPAQCVGLTECSKASGRCVCRGITFEAGGRCVTDDDGIADWEPAPAPTRDPDLPDGSSTTRTCGFFVGLLLVLALLRVR